jgi:hypothetical protein
LFHFVEPIRYYIPVARLGLAKAPQPLALQRQYPALEFRIFFDPVDKIPLKPLNSILPTDPVPDTERIAEVSILASTPAPDVDIKRFLVDVNNDGLHYWFPFPFLVADKKRICTRPSLLMPFTEISMFPFYGGGKFSDPARPPPGTPVRSTGISQYLFFFSLLSSEKCLIPFYGWG